MKKLISLILTLSLLISLGTVSFAAETTDSKSDDGEVHIINLSSSQNEDGTYTHSATIDGETIEEFDYAWHADPSEDHGEVKNSPAEYFTGTKPETEAAAYIAHDVYYYPELDTSLFKKVVYDDETEWAYYYTAEGYEDYIFGTLPVQGSEIPTQFMHSEEEAYQNAVLHITEPGTYKLVGEWHGQILIDLGDTDDTFTDENAKVTIILGGADVTCTVAPSLIFYSVYECDNTWEDAESYSNIVDTANAGANVIIEDGSVNNFSGTNVYRMLKTKYKSDSASNQNSVTLQKKARKTDGAFYSYVSMNVDGGEKGDGVLNITAGAEGLDTELHLTINGGNINIFSQDDGINVNEDGVSVVTFNGGSTHILAGLGSEGDGIDSNGFITINGGTVISMAKPQSDSGLDSDSGTFVYGGTVVALGSTMDYASSDVTADEGQAVMNLRFSTSQKADEAIIVTDTDGKVVFAYDPDKDEVAGTQARTYSGAIISAPGIEISGEYYVYVGGDVTGEETEGIYDVSTVTGFSSEAVQQCYTGTDTLGGFGGFGGFGGNMGERPDNMNGEMPEMPDNMNGERPEMPDNMNGERPEMPDNMNGERPEMPDNMNGERPEMPDNMNGERPEMPDNMGDMGGQMPENMGNDRFNETTDLSNASIVFKMEKKVNSFSGVCDYVASETPLFSDVSSDDWFYDDVKYATENGIMNGTSSTTFSPDKTTTRGMIVTMLYRMEGEPETTSKNTFKDVETGSYYEKAVIWANSVGIVNGYGEGKFGPNDSITREQLAAIMYRYAAYKGYNTEEAADLEKYTDSNTIHSYAKEAMSWANASGLITGNTDTTLNPLGTAKRSQTAAVFHRFIEKFN